MDFEEIKQILAMMREHELSEFELEHQGFKIRIKKEGGQLAVAPPQTVAAAPDTVALPSPLQTDSAPPALSEDEAVELDFAIVKSPIVGTFFRASEPGARPFAEIGDIVKQGQVLCIIEAMKLMNEIDSEYDGEVVKVFVENGQPVQFGERLFAIKAK
jgi:acetyl-CoA carboxylase biotin carboxyl carrier protein